MTEVSSVLIDVDIHSVLLKSSLMKFKRSFEIIGIKLKGVLMNNYRIRTLSQMFIKRLFMFLNFENRTLRLFCSFFCAESCLESLLVLKVLFGFEDEFGQLLFKRFLFFEELVVIELVHYLRLFLIIIFSFSSFWASFFMLLL